MKLPGNVDSVVDLDHLLDPGIFIRILFIIILLSHILGGIELWRRPTL